MFNIILIKLIFDILEHDGVTKERYLAVRLSGRLKMNRQFKADYLKHYIWMSKWKGVQLK